MSAGPQVKHILLIVVDALRRDRVGALGSSADLTPNIDRLADEGTIFERAFSTCNATDPAVTSLHTGRFPRTTVYHHGKFVTDVEKERVEATTPLPVRLRDADVDTVATGRPMGRWHRRGFRVYPTVREQTDNSRFPSPKHILQVSPQLCRLGQRLYDKYDNALSSGNDPAQSPSYESLYQNYDTGDDPVAVFNKVVRPEPTYSFVHLMDTHTPYLPHPSTVAERLRESTYERSELSLSGHERSLVKPSREDYEYGTGRIIARYDAAVIEADQTVGRLLNLLEQRGIRDKTTVIVTSDHGESLTEHGIICDHHGLYDQSIHVPLVVDVPGTNGGAVDEFVQLTDLTPTILQLYELEPPAGIHGRSLLTLLDDDESWQPRDFVVAEEAHTQRKVAIRTADHKYIEHEADSILKRRRGNSLECAYCGEVHGAEHELYNLHEDPEECRNIVDKESVIAERLHDRLQGFLSGLTAPTATASPAKYDDEEVVMKRLEELGYR